MTDERFLKEDLIQLRKDMGLTQQQMAHALDMALRSYQSIEFGSWSTGSFIGSRRSALPL